MAIEVTGNTPTGKRSSPMRALISDDLPLLEPAAHRNAKIAFAQALGQLVGTPFEHRIQLGCSFAKQPDRTQ
ncbi:MAG: hypothetical protein IPH38_11155 [Candidatus Microthrix sp.]|nr:hypothetical protein [Candidatus Microthrix sp.]MBK7020119.1 hypothetical protein [Candidatus Microthrix sp.]